MQVPDVEYPEMIAQRAVEQVVVTPVQQVVEDGAALLSSLLFFDALL